jgi:hypothetical protein
VVGAHLVLENFSLSSRVGRRIFRGFFFTGGDGR